MSLRGKKGFTLVELVVVIAVLAILAGIAVPLYAGYIDKAHEAADLQLLDSMNTAFAAACAARGIDPRALDSEEVNIVTEGGRNAVAGLTIPTFGSVGEAIGEDFRILFGGNSETEFRTYDVSELSLQGGVFTRDGNPLGARWNNSNFKGNAAALLGSLDDLSGAITSSATLNAILRQLNDNPELYPELAEAFGDFPGVIKAYGFRTTERGNVAILFIAQDSEKLDVNTAYSNVNTVISALQGIEELSPDSESLDSTVEMLSHWGGDTTALTKVSLAYAVATGFFKSEYCDEEEQVDFQGNSLTDALNYIKAAAGSSQFQRYLENEGRADVSAYLAAMSLLDRNADSIMEKLSASNAFSQQLHDFLSQLGVEA